MGSEELRLVVKARDEASAVLRGIGGPAGFGKMKVLAVAAVAAIAVGLAVLTKKLLDLGDMFDEAFDTIRIGTGATGADLEVLKEDFKAVFADVPQDAAEVSTAIADLNTRLGLTGKPLQTMARQFLDLSRITKTDVAQNIRLGTRLFGDWSVASRDQADAMDLVFRASQMSGIGISDLMSTVVQFGAPLRNMGFAFEDSVAMLAKWEKEGVNTETVLTGMKFALKTFAKAGDDPQKALAALIPKMRDMKDEQAAMTLGMQVFGLRAGPDMVAAIREGRFEYADFATEIKNGKDTIAAATKDTDSWREALEKLKHKGMVALEPAASAVTGAFTVMMNGILALTENKSVLAFFRGLGDALSGAFAAVGGVVSDVWAVVGPVITRIYGHVKTHLVDKLMAAMPTIKTIWNEFVTTLTVVWERTKAFAAGVSAAIAAVVGFVRKHWGTLGPIVRNVWNIVEAYVKTALKVIANTIRLVMAVIRGDWSGAWQQVKAIVRAAWDGIKAVVSNALGALKKILSGLGRKILGWIGDLGGLLKNAGRSLIQGLIDGIKSKAESIVSTIKTYVTDKIPGFVKDALGIGSPSKVFYGFGVNLMQGLALGIGDTSSLIDRALTGIAGNLALNVAPQVGVAGMPFAAAATRSAGGLSPLASAQTAAGATGDGALRVEFSHCNFSAHTPQEIAESVVGAIVEHKRGVTRTSGTFA